MSDRVPAWLLVAALLVGGLIGYALAGRSICDSFPPSSGQERAAWYAACG